MTDNYREEKMQILKMVEDGKITIEEGVELLDALGGKMQIDNNRKRNAKWLKIRVYDPDDDTKVNVTLPITFINLGMKFAYKFSPELKDTGLDEDDFKELFDAIKNGAEGKLVDVESENGEKVEIVVE
jgi:hypothetical protein